MTHNCETQPPASIGWVALSSLVRSFVCRHASVTSPLISTIWCFRAYKLYIVCEDMILATCQCQHIFCCCLLLSSFPLFDFDRSNLISCRQSWKTSQFWKCYSEDLCSFLWNQFWLGAGVWFLLPRTRSCKISTWQLRIWVARETTLQKVKFKWTARLHNL